MKKLLTTLIALNLLVCLGYGQFEFNFGSTDGNTFGEFGTGNNGETATSISTDGTAGASFPLVLAGSVATAGNGFDFTTLNASDQITISGFRDAGSDHTSSSIRFYSDGFAAVYRLNFDLTSLPTTSGNTVVGTVGDFVAIGGDASDIVAIGIQLESASTGSWNFTIDSISVAAVPEPSSFGLIFGTLALGVVAVRRRKA